MTDPGTVWPYVAVAFVIATAWMVLARKEYRYNRRFAEVLGINVFPLVSWTAGLAVMMMLFDRLATALALRTLAAQAAVFSMVYWILLLAAETIGYHVFNIHNDRTARCRGIPILNCMHAPGWMKAAYFAMGPVMFLSCRLIFH